MSLDSILNHILNEANAQREKVIQHAQKEAQGIIQHAQKEADDLYKELMEKEKALHEAQKQKIVVNARLEAKKNLLKTKQELIDSVFIRLKSHLRKDKFKKQRVSHDKIEEIPEDIDFYLNKIKPDYETEIARILFE